MITDRDPGDEQATPCVVSDFSSRCCERGTKACNVRHDPGDEQHQPRTCGWCGIAFGSTDGVVPTEKGRQRLCHDHVMCDNRRSASRAFRHGGRPR